MTDIEIWGQMVDYLGGLGYVEWRNTDLRQGRKICNLTFPLVHPDDGNNIIGTYLYADRIELDLVIDTHRMTKELRTFEVTEEIAGQLISIYTPDFRAKYLENLVPDPREHFGKE